MHFSSNSLYTIGASLLGKKKDDRAAAKQGQLESPCHSPQSNSTMSKTIHALNTLADLSA